MLHLIFGRSGTGKTARLIRAAGEAAASGRRALFLVPEQSTVITERALIDSLGVASMKNIEVLSFRRLCNNIFKEAGGLARRYISDAGRYILMGGAFDGLRPMLLAFGGAKLTPDFIEKLLETDTEFKQYNVDTDRLENAARTVENPRRRHRLTDLARITNAYNALMRQSFDDAGEDIDYCAGLLCEYPLYNGAVLFLDAFTGFTPQQLKLLEPLMRQSKDLYAALCADGPVDDDGGYGLFSHVKKTAFALRHMAERQGVETAEPVILTRRLYSQKESLLHLERHLFSPEPHLCRAKDDAVTFYTADDPFDEVRFAAREICRLLREDGLRHRDIAVIARNTEDYAGIVDAVFRHYGIALFCDQRVEILQKPPILLIMSLLDILCGGFDTDAVFRCLKTGLWNIDEDMLCTLEAYAERWNISGERWIDARPFAMHPRGFQTEWTAEDDAVLERVNAAREQFAGPMKTLLRNIKNAADMEGYCRALYGHLTALAVPDTLERQARRFKDMGEMALASEQSSLWDVLVDAFDQIAQAGKHVKTDLLYFRELLKAVFSSIDIGKIPTSLDEVIFGDARRMRTGVKPCVFVLGLNEDVFPAAVRDTRLVNDGDRKALSKADSGLILAEPTEYQVFEEPYYAYSVFTRASKRLYLSCHKTGFDGGEARPSQLFTNAGRLLPDACRRATQTDPLLSFIERPSPSFEYLASGEPERQNPAIADALRALFQEKEDTAEKLKALESIRFFGVGDHISPQMSQMLYGRDISVSPSRIESYAGCKFLYFCRYGLRLSVNKRAELAADTAGTFLHRALEKILGEAAQKGIIGSMGEDDIARRSSDMSKEYLLTYLGGEKEKTARFLYLYKRLSRAATELLRALNEEFAQSEFRPEGFEVRLARGGDIPPLRLPFGEGRSVRLSGVADRVDIYRRGQERFLRVVDYKSGGRVFRLADCYNGLGIQMLLYLNALCRNGQKRFGEGLLPAGVLYYPARDDYVKAPRRINDSELRRLRRRALRQNGLLLDDIDVLRAMEKELAGSYIPVSLKRDGMPRADSGITGREEMSALLHYCEDRLVEMGKEIARGDAAVQPLRDSSGKINPCRYCDFRAVCGFEPDRLSVKPYINLSRGEVLDYVCSRREKDGKSPPFNTKNKDRREEAEPHV